MVLRPFTSFKEYIWSTGDKTSVITINSPGNYSLEVVDANGCKAKESIVIHSKKCLTGLLVPNAFTPNRDGKNDTFKPFLFGEVKRYLFTIYNRGDR